MWARCSVCLGWGRTKVKATWAQLKAGREKVILKMCSVKKIFSKRLIIYKRSPGGKGAPFSSYEKTGYQRIQLYYSKKLQILSSDHGHYLVTQDSACKVKNHTFSFWIMTFSALCLSGFFPKSLPRYDGNGPASHAPTEVMANFIVPRESSCWGRKVMKAVPRTQRQLWTQKKHFEVQSEVVSYNMDLMEEILSRSEQFYLIFPGDEL